MRDFGAFRNPLDAEKMLFSKELGFKMKENIDLNLNS
jgi:hypothetical protein